MMFTASEAPRQLVGAIEDRVRLKTHGRVRDLKVELADKSIVLLGITSTYYVKQLALHGALDAVDGLRIVNQIRVV